MRKTILVLALFLFGFSLKDVIDYVRKPVDAVVGFASSVVGASVNAATEVYNSATLKS